ncbi:MAG TPA: hypothetical protein DD490_33290 [Acidobacteria bacterium]|nr:hypothetical protein [Acidobacteriota bacterium]
MRPGGGSARSGRAERNLCPLPGRTKTEVINDALREYAELEGAPPQVREFLQAMRKEMIEEVAFDAEASVKKTCPWGARAGHREPPGSRHLRDD